MFFLTGAIALLEKNFRIANLSPHHFFELVFFYAFGLYLGECEIARNRLLFIYAGTILGFLLVFGQIFNAYMSLFVIVLTLGLPVGYTIEKWYQKKKK